MAEPPGWTPPTDRTGLQKVRDISLTVMAVLVSLFVVFLFYVSFSIGEAFDDVRDNWNNSTTPEPAFTQDFDEPIPTNSAGEECVGEEVPAGC